MRHLRHQRMISVHGKQNQVNRSNLPQLEGRCTNKLSLKNEFRLNLKDRKKTFLKLSTRGNIPHNYHIKESITDALISARLPNNSISPKFTAHRQYISSRQDKKTTTKHSMTSTLASPKENSNGHILSRHKITLKMRAKMIDWLMEISDAYHLKDQTLFLAIYLMDQYFRKCREVLGVGELHCIGVTCIFMACKYEEIHPLRLKTVFKDIGHGKIPQKKILQLESQVLEAINFSFAFPCSYKLCQEAIYQMSQEATGKGIQKIKHNINYFLKLCLFDLDLLYGREERMLSKACILAAIRSNSESPSNLQLYDSFVSTCHDYENLHGICTQVFASQANFTNCYGDLPNISKLNPVSKKSLPKFSHKMIQSCAL